MTPTLTGKTVFRLCALAVVLLVLYALASLLTAIKFLGADALMTSLPYPHTALLTDTLGHLAIVSGLMGAGLWIAASSRPEAQIGAPSALRLLGRSWWVIVALSALAALLHITDGRSGVDLPALLRLAQAAAMIAAIGLVWRAAPARSGVVLVWLIGLIIHVVGLILALLPFDHPLTVWTARSLALNVQTGGLMLAALAVIYWLLHRISDVTPGWAQSSLYTTAGLLVITAAARIVSDLVGLLPTGSLDTFSALLSGAAVIAWLIVLAHAYHALSRRNPTQTLAGHWIILAYLAWFINALISAAASVPALRPNLAGTRAADAADALIALGLIAIVLAGINQITAELRGENRRITGLIPVWLVSAGAIGGGLLLAIAGIVQAYLERAVQLGYLETQALLVPLYVGWVAALILIALGAVSYGLGLAARRPCWREEAR